MTLFAKVVELLKAADASTPDACTGDSSPLKP
jgi:hypothetical protein